MFPYPCKGALASLTLPSLLPYLQASRDCLNFEYSYDLVKVAGYEEMLLVHIRRANNSSTIESGDIVDLSICSVTLRGLTGRSNGRFAPHHTGARTHSPPVCNHFEHHFFIVRMSTRGVSLMNSCNIRLFLHFLTSSYRLVSVLDRTRAAPSDHMCLGDVQPSPCGKKNAQSSAIKCSNYHIY
jgi:hypothetical protein